MKKTTLVTLIVALLVSLLAAGATAGPSNSAALTPEVEATLATLAQGEMTTVIVTLRDRAELAAVRGTTRGGRLKAAMRTLKSKASTSQQDIRALLRRRASENKVAKTTPFWIVNGISVTATAEVIRELAKFPGVESITSDDVPIVPSSGAPQPNIAAATAPALWDRGYHGQGIVVATLDSGVDLSHPDLAGRWRGGTNSWFDPYGQHPTSPVDPTGHGTGTMGVIVGGDAGGTSIGVAPGAKWIAARIFNDKGASTATAIHAAFQWVLDPDGNPDTADAPNVVNNSWSYGYAGTCNLAFQPDVQALRAAGIVPVFAAGNFGPGSSTSVSPANYPESLAVGAVDNLDQIYSASSRGPSHCGEASTTYPELVAPGVNIRTAGRYGTYQTLSGTSLAAPHVAGALALLLSANPNLSPSAQEEALERGAHDLGTAGIDNLFGFGRLDILAALGDGGSSPPDFNLAAAPSPVSVTAGGSGTSAVTVSALNSFSADVALSASGLPSGATAVFSPALISGGGGVSQLTLSTSPAVAAGTYPLTITGSAGASTHTLAVSLLVAPAPDFRLAAVPPSVPVTAGGSGTSAVTVSALNGFSADVALSASGLPAGATAGFSPTVVPGGSGSSQLTVSTSAAVAAGTYTLTISGGSGSLAHTTSITLVVSAPAQQDFTLNVTPAAFTIKRGSHVAITVLVGAAQGSTSLVTVSVLGLPSRVTGSLSSNPIAPGGSSSLVLSAARTAAIGTYTITIQGNGGGRTHAALATLTVAR